MSKLVVLLSRYFFDIFHKIFKLWVWLIAYADVFEPVQLVFYSLILIDDFVESHLRFSGNGSPRLLHQRIYPRSLFNNYKTLSDILLCLLNYSWLIYLLLDFLLVLQDLRGSRQLCDSLLTVGSIQLTFGFSFKLRSVFKTSCNDKRRRISIWIKIIRFDTTILAIENYGVIHKHICVQLVGIELVCLYTGFFL